MPDLERPILALVGHLLDQDDPEFRSLETAQRWFEKKVGSAGASDRDVGLGLIWLAAARVQLFKLKGAQHTLGHLRARFRGRFPDLEVLASIMEIKIQLEMGDYRGGSAMLDRLKVDLPDPRMMARVKAMLLQLRGEILSNMGQTKVAQNLFVQAFEALRTGPAQQEDLAIMAEISNSQGYTFQREGRAEDAIKAFQQAETVAKHIGFKLSEARCLRGRGNLAMTRKQLEEANQTLKQALELYQDCAAPHGILKTCISLGRSHYQLGEYRQALLYYEEARVQCGTGTFPADEAEVCACIGHIMLAEGQYEKAAEFYEQDLQIATASRLERSRAIALRNVGRIQRLLGNYPRAEACLDEARLLFQNGNDKHGLCLTLQQLVQCFVEQGKTTQSREALEWLKETSNALGRTFEKGVAEMLEGVVLRHEGESDAALTQLQRSLRSLSTEPGFYTVWGTMELAQALEDNGKRPDAVSRFKEAIQMARTHKLPDLEKRALDLLAHVDRSEWARALHGGGQARVVKRRNAARVFLSVLIVELRNLTSYASSHEPEESAQLVNRFFEVMANVIEENKGILNKVMGERMMALFGLGNPCDPGQALACANSCLTAFYQIQKEDPSLDVLGVACALATGEAMEGMFGPRDRLEYTVLGRPISLAQRLLAQTDHGEIMVCGDTFRAVGHHVQHPVARDVVARANEQKLVAYQVASSRPALVKKV
ncbi:MAG: tetratricopeptide repeat protein [Candidatus Eremiobacterota bacterium]